MSRGGDRRVGGQEAYLVIDDVALCCGELGDSASCMSLVSLTMAQREVPVGLWLFPPVHLPLDQ